MGDRLVRVYSTGRIFDGELTKARLEDEGIPVLLKGEGNGPYRLGPVYLFVSAEQEARAREIIEAIARGEYATEDLEPEPEPER